MNKKVMKVLAILMVAMMVVFSLTQFAFADMPSPTDFDNRGNSAGIDSVSNVIGSILKLVRTVAIGVAVIMLIVLAIKYISAAPSEKADIKKSATIYIVGAVLLFAASGVLTIIQQFADNIK